MESNLDEIKSKIPQIKDKKYLLHYACETQDVELVKQLLSLDEIDVNTISIGFNI